MEYIYNCFLTSLFAASSIIIVFSGSVFVGWIVSCSFLCLVICNWLSNIVIVYFGVLSFVTLIFLHSILRYSCYLDFVWSFKSCSQMSWVLDQNSFELGLIGPIAEVTVFRGLDWVHCVLWGLCTKADGGRNYLHLYVGSGNCVAYCFPVLLCPVLISFLLGLCRSVLRYRIEGIPQQISRALPITLSSSTLSHKF